MSFFPCPKPEPGRHKPGVINRTNRSDGKQVIILRSSTEWEALRQDVGEEADYRCRHCNRPAPLHDEEIDNGDDVMPTLIRAGQLAHRRARKMGGGSRDDKRVNVLWLCAWCHHLETIGRLVIA